jgi:hypothetical protein
VGCGKTEEARNQRAQVKGTSESRGTDSETRIRESVHQESMDHNGRVALEQAARVKAGRGCDGRRAPAGGESARGVQLGLPNFPARGRERGGRLPPTIRRWRLPWSSRRRMPGGRRHTTEQPIAEV